MHPSKTPGMWQSLLWLPHFPRTPCWISSCAASPFLGHDVAQPDDNLKLAVKLVFSDCLPLRLLLSTTTFIKHFKFYTMGFKYLFMIWLHWVLVADTGSLIVTCKFLVAAHGMEFPDQGLDSSPLHREHGIFSHWTTREVPIMWIFKLCSMDHQRRAS